MCGNRLRLALACRSSSHELNTASMTSSDARSVDNLSISQRMDPRLKSLYVISSPLSLTCFLIRLDAAIISSLSALYP